jgi:hypothetical protein
MFLAKMARMAKDVYGEDIAELNQEIADLLAEKSRREASGMGGVYAKAAPAIVGAGTVRAARIRVKATKQYRFAPAAFWGTKRRSGWYAARRFEGSGGEQHPYWVGNTWDVGVKGQGPYAINNAIADNIDDVLELWEKRLQEIINR